MTEAQNPEEYLQGCIDINLVDLNEDFVRVPADISYWNSQLADVSRLEATAKLDLDRAKGQLFVALRSQGGTKPTAVEAVKAAVDADEDIYQLELAYIMLTAERIRTRGIVDAISAKRDMLQSLGAKLRAEMRTEPSINHSF